MLGENHLLTWWLNSGTNVAHLGEETQEGEMVRRRQEKVERESNNNYLVRDDSTAKRSFQIAFLYLRDRVSNAIFEHLEHVLEFVNSFNF